MSNAHEATSVDRIEELLRSGDSLDRESGEKAPGVIVTAALLRALGEPQEAVPAAHIAGTSGKGSVACFLTAILRAHGFRTGTHMSPHVDSVLERFQINGVLPSPSSVIAVAESVNAAAEHDSVAGRYSVNYVDKAVATAFALFAASDVHFSVIETGLGGRLDATNTITSHDKVAAITAIGLDHTDVLGSTLEEIAREKAGILPRNGSAVALCSDTRSDGVLKSEAKERGCQLRFLDRVAVDVMLPAHITPGLHGAHQRGNAALAIATATDLALTHGWTLHDHIAYWAVERANLPGRFEVHRTADGPVILDGAHNPMKLAALKQTVDEQFPGLAPVWVLALPSDKDARGVVRALFPFPTIITAALSERGDDRPSWRDPDELAMIARTHGTKAVAVAGLAAAMRRAREVAGPNRPVVACGSFRLVSAIRRECT